MSLIVLEVRKVFDCMEKTGSIIISWLQN